MMLPGLTPFELKFLICLWVSLSTSWASRGGWNLGGGGGQHYQDETPIPQQHDSTLCICVLLLQ